MLKGPKHLGLLHLTYVLKTMKSYKTLNRIASLRSDECLFKMCDNVIVIIHHNTKRLT